MAFLVYLHYFFLVVTIKAMDDISDAIKAMISYMCIPTTMFTPNHRKIAL